MSTLLHIDSSPLAGNSISRRLTAEFAARWRAANVRGTVIYRDLTQIAIPPIDAAWISANVTPRELRSREQNEILALSNQFTNELLASDEYVFGVPMHNWGPCASFKLWIDQIVRFGETLAVTPSGPRGTLGSKRATFFLAAGRRYDSASGDPSTNHLLPWLKTFFGHLGLKDMIFIVADGAAEVTCGKLDRSVFLAPHIQTIDALFATPSRCGVNK